MIETLQNFLDKKTGAFLWYNGIMDECLKHFPKSSSLCGGGDASSLFLLAIALRR